MCLIPETDDPVLEGSGNLGCEPERTMSFSNHRSLPFWKTPTSLTPQQAEDIREWVVSGEKKAVLAREFGTLPEQSESSFSPDHSFYRCATFWRDTSMNRFMLIVVFLLLVNKERDSQDTKWPRDVRRKVMYSFAAPHILILEGQLEKLRQDSYAASSEQLQQRFVNMAVIDRSQSQWTDCKK